ncbi:hypothetical protein [Chengkuizengella axinellae]|uniref:Uncharacterized protein n=1 Tax=Chengkuizengella axinellae TaxID=3064388 RepID=A0ABT9J3D7_9BACL|nr:hypothetical protein [Chengkuizengella sp. 2205SS18-9]MDP5276109.1 hypothetical protein [Chengkuizengella sp. 2205SS18-9]
MIQFTTPYFPPPVDRKDGELKHRYKMKWFNSIREQLKDHHQSYEAINVEITYFFDTLSSQDLDNIEFKYIIDAFRQLKIIPDDTWRRVSIRLEGEYDPYNPRTVIKVVPREIKSYKKLKYRNTDEEEW